ncbi:DUF1253-domain-containing protein [Lichtheimia hyalospora FSU 10163]|nr:DUF1253-domain-containing protein [Lichtheimia hyalospora FSU 10163]
MAKSAVSKSMARKRSQEPTQHVSGLSTSKSGAKRKNDNVKFGSLSRKQKNDLKEYGTLIPDDFHDEDEDDDMNEQGPKKRPRRIVYEEDLDRELEEEAGMDESDESEEEEEEEEEEWQKPSAYSRLVGSLQKTSKHRDFYERIKREQQGVEDIDEDDEQEDEDIVEDDDEDMDEEEELVDEDDEDAEEEQDNEASVDEEEQENELEEEEEIMIGDLSDDEDNADPFERRLSDEQPKSFDEDIALADQKKWTTEMFQDDALKEVAAFTLHPDKYVKEQKPIKDLAEINVKERLARRWKEANSDFVDEKDESVLFTPLQERLFRYFNEHRDVLYCNRTVENAAEIRNAYALHILNYIYKTNHRVVKNNAKIANAHKENKEIGEIRDQGFTRPKVLLILPFRNSVVKVVDALIKASGTDQQENKKRFYDEFRLRDDDQLNKDKPADYVDTFSGNVDDHFRFGIKFGRKTMKFYSGLFASDMIIASPLGLRTLINGEEGDERNHDALSSIELVVMDQTNHIMMQNWEHVEYVMQHLNLIPEKTHGCDISRIKSWYLDRKACYLRQTLVFSEFLTPEINGFFSKYLKNVSGKIKIKQRYEDGSILDVIPQVQQTFTRIDTTSLAAMNDTRFKYFIEKTLPTLRKSALMQTHTLIFVPSYFDYVRLRNYFEDNMYSYDSCCEYTDPRDMTRARGNFFQGKVSFLLYTERLHFYRRLNIRGTFHVVFYGLPDHPQFYSEVVNFLGLKFDEASAAEEATFSCTTLFSRYDHLKLERIVGSDRARKMCTAQKNVFMFA